MNRRSATRAVGIIIKRAVGLVVQYMLGFSSCCRAVGKFISLYAPAHLRIMSILQLDTVEVFGEICDNVASIFFENTAETECISAVSAGHRIKLIECSVICLHSRPTIVIPIAAFGIHMNQIITIAAVNRVAAIFAGNNVVTVTAIHNVITHILDHAVKMPVNAQFPI